MNRAFEELFESSPPWELVCIQAPTYEALFDEGKLYEVFEFEFDSSRAWNEDDIQKLCGAMAEAVEVLVTLPFCAITTSLGEDLVIGSSTEVLHVLRQWASASAQPKGLNA